jgi:hypothetical protein
MIAEPLDGAAARAVLQADGVPIGVKAFVFVETRTTEDQQ